MPSDAASRPERGNQEDSPDPTVFVAHRGGVDVDAPGDRKAIIEDALALLTVCQQELERTAPEDPARGRFNYEIARLQESILDAPDEALRHYRAALETLPDHLPSLQGARRILRARGLYRELLPLFDEEIRLTADPRRRATLMYTKGRVLTDHLGRTNDAREAYASAIELNEGDLSLLTALEQCTLEAEAWDELLQVYEKQAAAIKTDGHHRSALIAARARIAEVRQNDLDMATELYQVAANLDRGAPAVLEALKRLYHRRKQWPELVQILEQQAELVDDSATRRLALYRVARIQAERLGNVQEAISALQRACDESPPDPLVLEELARLHEKVGNISEQISALRRLARVTDEPRERIGILHRIGWLCTEQLGDDTAAVEAYERALEIDPTYVPALRALAPLYVQREQWNDLVRMHLREAQTASDSNRRAAAHVRAAEVLEVRLQRLDEAAGQYEQALALVPGSEASLKALGRLYRASQRHRDLVGVYERAIDITADESRAVAYLFQIGDLYENPLGQPAEALDAYRKILARQPQNLSAIHAVQRAAESAGKFRELVEMLDRETESTDDAAAKVELAHRAAEILHDRLEDREAARERFRRILELDPLHRPTLASLGRSYHAAGHWEQLIDVYDRELRAATPGPDDAALCHKMGEICEKQVGDRDSAKDHYRRALELDPSYGPSLHALGRLLQSEHAWTDLVEIVEQERDSYKDPRSRALSAYRAGEIHDEHLEDPDEAMRAYDQALQLLPSYRPAIEALQRLRGDGEYWADLVEILEQEAARATDDQRVRSIYSRAAEIYRDHLEDHEGAIRCLRAVLERNPDDLPAILALEPLYRRSEDWERLAELYGHKCRAVQDTGAKVAALRERARILALHDIGDEDTLIDTYTSILGLQPEASDVLATLEQMALQSGDPRVLASVDGRIAGSVRDPALLGAHLTRMAESLEAAGNPHALEVYRKALQSDTDSRAAMRGLARMGELLGDQGAIAEACRREADITLEPALAAELRTRNAELLADAGDREAATEAAVTALKDDPDHEGAARLTSQLLRNNGDTQRLASALTHAAVDGSSETRIAALSHEVAALLADEREDLGAALTAIRRIVGAHPDHVPARLSLAKLLARNGQWQECAETLQFVDSKTLGDHRREVHLTLAIANRHLGETKAAYQSFDVVLEIDPQDREALLHVAELQASEGAGSAAIGTAKRLLQTATSIEEKVRAMLLIATIEENRGDHEQALEQLSKAVVMEGPGGRAAKVLAEVASGPEDWQRYVTALESRLQAEDEDIDMPAIHLEIARVQYERLEDREAALVTLMQGIGRHDSPLLRLELAARLRQSSRTAEAAEELQRLLMADPTRVEGWRHLAHTFEELGHTTKVPIAIAPLQVLGAITSTEQALLRRHPPRPASAGAGTITDATILSLSIPDLQQHPAAELVRLLGHGLGKLRPDPLDRYGLTTRDRLTARSGSALFALAERLAAIFAIEEYQVYRVEAEDAAVRMELLPTPALLLPSALAKLPPTQQVYAVARPLAILALGLQAGFVVAAKDLELLLAAAGHAADPRFGTNLASAEILAEQHRLLLKGLPRKYRRSMEQAAATYASDGHAMSTSRWIDGLQQTARRIATIVADDLTAAIEYLRTTEGFEDRDIKLVHGSARVRDLLGSWISPAAFAVRERAGMLATAR